MQQTPESNKPKPNVRPDELFAAIDMGSNSFHLVTARIQHDEIRLLEKRGEKVQLGAGLNANSELDEASQQRALACLERFRERVGDKPAGQVLIVGTNALREARNAQAFLQRAEAVIGHPISIISGREEARLIYLGVAHSLADDAGKRLVIDIGGGSTEFIIGERFEPIVLESLDMGCVSYRNRYFSDGTLSQATMGKAILEASREVLSIRRRYRQLHWDHAVGSSGTVKAVQNALASAGLNADRITRDDLEKLINQVIKIGHIDGLDALGVRSDRQSVFASGLAILTAAFDVLEIESMEFCDGALREGLLYDMLGRNTHEDVRERTIKGLQTRYHVDTQQADNVEQTAIELWQQVAFEWDIASLDCEQLLRWASRLHEIGLAIAHNGFHKHGGYLLEHSDMAGFSRQAQQDLAILVTCHRRKIHNNLPREELSEEHLQPLLRLAVILRLAVVLNHSRSLDLPTLKLALESPNALTLCFEPQWLANHPLLHADLQAEIQYLSKVQILLICQNLEEAAD